MKRDWCTTVLIINESSNKVLLIKKREEPKKIIPGKKPFKIPSRWAMSGGRRDAGDKDEEYTGWREVKEEVGLKVLISSDFRVEEDRGDHLAISFIGYLSGGQIRTNEEVVEWGWFPIRVLEDYPALLRRITGDPNARMHPKHLERAQELLRLRRARQKRG